MTYNRINGFGPARRGLWLLGVPAIFLASACSDPGITSDVSNVQLGVHKNDPVAGNPDASFEFLTLCKQWTNASDIGVDFDVTIDPDNNLTPPAASTQTRTLTSTGSFECRNVAVFASPPTDLMVVESVPTGTTLLDIQVTGVTRGGKTLADYNPVTDVSTGTWTADGADNNVGFKVVYINEVDPPVGGEGCTPGYWKNHAGPDSHSRGGQNKPSAWQVYSPTDDYDTVFGVTSSFGGTLIDALTRGGGGENALGRHAVAALLNSAHSGVSYAFSTSQVIALVQGAYLGGDFTGAKNQLAFENERGCPL